MEVDVVILGGKVVDGTGAPEFGAAIGIRDGRVVAVSREGPGGLRGAETVDAGGLVIAPGFVDSNTHADWAVLAANAHELLAPALRQGVTTVVGGGCGFSPAPVDREHPDQLDLVSRFLQEGAPDFEPASFGDFIEACASARPVVNLALMVGHQALRCAVAGLDRRSLDASQRARLRGLLRECIAAGAVGVSANFGFVPGVYADLEERKALAEEASTANVVLAVHARAYSALSTTYPPWPRPPHSIRALRELTRLAAETGVRLQVSHLGVVGRRSWRLADALLEELDAGRRAGADVDYDVVPYPLGVGPLQMVFPAWAVQELQDGRLRRVSRLGLHLLAALQPRALGLGFDDVALLRSVDDRSADLAGLDFAEIARRWEQSPIDAQIAVALQTRLGASVALCGFSGDRTDEGPLETLLGQGEGAVVSNAAFSSGGTPNPAARGAFPRLLGRFVRTRRILTLEEAVRRVTSLPAERLGLADVGTIKEGATADMVVFDPVTVDDVGWRPQPSASPIGIDTVILGGRVVVSRGALIGAPNGRILRH